MTARLLVALGIAAALGAAPRDPPRAALERAVSALMAAQGEDGGWHSETYGSMRAGAAVTTLVLYALSHVPENVWRPYRERLARAYAFLQTGTRKAGCVANPDGSLDYPTYSSAMLLVAARRLKLDLPADDTRRLVEFLQQAQLGESRSFVVDSPHYGGWDLMGAQKIQRQTSGTNVSVSRFALEALASFDEPSVRTVRERALRWTAGCQRLAGDGGFLFTPDRRSENNKTHLEQPTPATSGPRSYGTATCDGLACLLLAGAARDDERVAAAVRWLVDHPGLDVVPGFEGLPAELDWQNGLRFYYYAAVARAFPYLPADIAQERREKILARLVADQRRDGFWQNDSARMREDDPLICTSMAIIALGELLAQEKSNDPQRGLAPAK